MAQGLFKKVVIADRLALLVDTVYGDLGSQSGGSLLLAAVFYSFQIYCDFSGYSDIAIGAARVMGFNLMENFNAPYSAKSIPEFWRRWHISLSTWFKDYVYFSLGGNRVSVPRWYLNIMIVVVLSGIWHGASWNFVIWGALHGGFQLLGLSINRLFPSLAADAQSGISLWMYRLWTFSLVTLAWVFFRLPHFSDIRLFFRGLSELQGLGALGLKPAEIGFSIALILGLLVWDSRGNLRAKDFAWLMPLLVICSYFLGVFSLKQFIYFQF
jgi:D-alanyl-lipoteichoic acid acyltransferase DltB (MBOAT superfamily)